MAKDLATEIEMRANSPGLSSVLKQNIAAAPSPGMPLIVTNN